MRSQDGWKAAVTLAVLGVAAISACSKKGEVSGGGDPARSATRPFFMSKMRIVPGLTEPLVTTKTTTESEDRALADATEGRDGATDALLAFLAAHPDSGWNAAIHTNLGLAYYRQGFFSKAIAAYEAAWKEGRAATDFRAKTLVDRAVAELAKMHARVGHLAEVDALIADIGDRSIQGGASELVTGAREGAWTMRHNPGIAFLCGPKALRNLMETLGTTPAALKVVDAARSGEHGFSLAEVSALADKARFKHRLIHREPGQPVPVPSVINWKVSHYAAIVGKTDHGTYQVKDPTFGGDLELSEAAIDEEGSGFFLAPATRAASSGAEPVRLAWRDATPAEAKRTYGMGFPGSYIQGAVTLCDAVTAMFTGAPATDLCNSLVSTGPSQCTAGMCQPTAHAMEVSLNIRDTPVGYAPPIGPPAYITLAYNQREAVEPNGPASNAVSFNVGPQWAINVLSYVIDNPKSQGVTVSRYVPGGGAVSAYTGYVAATGTFDAEKQSSAILTRTPATGMATSYTLTGTDGSQLVYAQNDGSTIASTYRRLFLTKIVDIKGNALTLNYDATLSTVDAGFKADSGFNPGSATFFPRLASLTDPTGVVTTTFNYGLDAAPLLVTKITDAFGRSATITYDANGRLSTITDVLGITSTITYDDGNTPARPTFVKQLKTPYGNTTFNYGEVNINAEVVTRWLETTDPLGQTERVEFAEGGTAGGSVGIPAKDETGVSLTAPSGMPLSIVQAGTLLLYRNTFFWNKHVYPTYGTGTGKDYTKAELVHWLHTNNQLFVAPTMESIRHPLEQRIWYQYAPGQANAVFEGPPATFLGIPTTIARVLDDDTTQLTSIARNTLGKPTLITDPVGRKTQFTYAANNTDLLQVQQITSASGSGLLGSYTYNAKHEPLSYADAAGQTTQYSYNDAGQLQRVTDALGNAQTIVYDDSGRVSKVQDANNLTTLTLTYDSANRVATRTDAVGYAVSYTYDSFDRVTKVSYPDGTSETYGYTNLDLTSATDRLGQMTTYGFDANRRLTTVTDPLMQVTTYAYYEDGTLKSITDPNKNRTSWDIDIQSRPVAKHYANGTNETYAYEATTGRLKSKTDAIGQVTSYAYNSDDSLAGLAYSGASNGGPPTAPVNFTYDPIFPRRTSMTDGIGTTTYSYYPIATNPALGAGRLQFVASPVAGAPGGAVDVISYAYDALGRVSGRSVNGTSQGVTYDPIGRPKTVTNALDAFNYTYADETSRPTRVTSLHGPAVALSYYDAVAHPEQNELLQQMTYTAPGGTQVLSQFGYGYDPNGNVEDLHRDPPRARSGDGRCAMKSLRLAMAPTLAAILAIGFTFTACGGGGGKAPVDSGGGDAIAVGNDAGGDTTAPKGDAGNDAPAAADGGATDALAVLQTQITTYQYDPASRLKSATIGVDGGSPAPSATPQFAYGYDPASNLSSIAANGPAQAFTFTSTNEIVGGNYDPNGSPKTVGGAQYTWDAANRLTSATVNGVESDFTYDGESRLVRVVSKRSGSIVSDKAYTWSGTTPLLEHDNMQSGSPVSKQYFQQGLIMSGRGYYYAADRLGSVRQLVDTTGAIRTQYDYDSYGNQTKLGGDVDSDAGFTGFFHHAPAGLDFATYRAYSASTGRWLNRDPLGESADVNLYGYSRNNPITATDPDGLCVTDTLGGWWQSLNSKTGQLWSDVRSRYNSSPAYLQQVKFEEWFEGMEHVALTTVETGVALATEEVPKLPSALAAVSVFVHHPVLFIKGLVGSIISTRVALDINKGDTRSLETYEHTVGGF